METLTEIYNDLLARDVMLFAKSYGLSGDCDAATVKIGQQFGVFLDIDRIRTLAQEKTAVSHEWSHIVTDATYGVDAPPALRQKAECRANRTQIKTLLPFDELRGAIKKGYDSIYELSEHFSVTEDFVSQAVAYYTGPCGLSMK